MIETLLVLILLGLVWALAACFVLNRRYSTLERLLHEERAETASRLDALESLAQDRWLTESATLGGQVSAMITTLEEAADRSATTITQCEAALTDLIAQADQRVAALNAAASKVGEAGSQAAPARRRAPRPTSSPDPGREAAERPASRLPVAVQRQAVHRLAAEGLTPVEIGRQTGLGIAEIDLILRLSRPEPLQPSA